MLQLRLDGPLSDRDLIHNPMSTESIFGNFIKVMERSAATCTVDFVKSNIVSCEDIEAVKIAAIQSIDAQISLKAFVFDRVASIKNLMTATPQDIYNDLEKSSKLNRMHQLAKLFEDHKDPIICLDEKGQMMAG